MSLTAAVIRELIAAGLSGPALADACQRIEDAGQPSVDEQAARRRAADRERKARLRIPRKSAEIADPPPSPDKPPHTPQINPPVRTPKGVLTTPTQPREADRQALLDVLRAEAGDMIDETSPVLSVTTDLGRWLDAGCDFERDIRPAVRTTCDRLRQQGRRPVRAWKFFDGPVSDAKANRLQPVPEGRATGPPGQFSGKRNAIAAIITATNRHGPNADHQRNQSDAVRLSVVPDDGPGGIPGIARRIHHGG